MLLFAALHRVSDGLPLSATTDVDPTPRVKECQKYIKQISRKLPCFSDRCTLSLDGYNIHFISTQHVTCLVLCEEAYPTVLAFCFLGELQREFLVSYDTHKLLNAKRPYAFIDFDNYLQKSKQRYNNPRTLTTRLNLSEMSQEIKLRPPYSLTEDDLFMTNGASRNGYNIPASTYRPPSNIGPTPRLIPPDWYHLLSVAINVFCALLNIFRGMSIIGHGHSDDEDWGAYRYGSAFLIACAFCFIQIYLIFYRTRWQQLWPVLSFLVRTSCLVYLSHFRDILQVAFHILSNIFITGLILGRKSEGKLPNYSV